MYKDTDESVGVCGVSLSLMDLWLCAAFPSASCDSNGALNFVYHLQK